LKINWKAAIIGGVIFWILALVFSYAGIGGWGTVIAALIGGFVGAWQAKDKKPADGLMTGLIAGIIGAIIAIILGYANLSSGTWPIILVGGIADWVIWGLIFGAIGGAIDPMVMKK
jgi:hypothetical protein